MRVLSDAQPARSPVTTPRDVGAALCAAPRFHASRCIIDPKSITATCQERVASITAVYRRIAARHGQDVMVEQVMKLLFEVAHHTFILAFAVIVAGLVIAVVSLLKG